MYAIVRTGGRQERVEEGSVITVDRLPAEEGATVELNDVLLLADNGTVTIGTPVIEGARVLTEVQAHGRAKKIIVFKYKSKVRTRKKTGHRQGYTRLSVIEILRPGQEPKAAAKPKRRRRRKADEEQPPADAAIGTAGTPTAEAAAPPRRRTRRKAAEEVPAGEAAAPKRRTRKKADAEAPAAEASVEAPPKRRTRKKAGTEEPAKGEASTAEETAKRPARRRTAKSDDAEGGAAEKKPTRRRTPRRKSSEETE